MDRKRAAALIEQGDIATLFADELMWNRLRGTVLIEVDGKDLALQSIAEKKQVQVLLCPPQSDGSLPSYALRQKIERQVTKQAREHLIVYMNAPRTAQVWQWVAREKGRPNAYREIIWQKRQAASLLLEKLGLIAFRLEEDDTLLTVLDVAGKLRDAFDRDKLTKRFYDDFKLERDGFLKFIKGMPADAAAWYTSVMINRLMFVYFLQRKQLANNEGFLDNRHDYLRHHLGEVQRKLGKNRFYADFLCPLFFQGFAQSDRRAEVKARFGDIPFLNGGLFNRHPLEEKYGGDVAIADAAFEKLFDYFDAWDWHLDDRPSQRSESELKSAQLRGEINPEVLGYIFEKYINQKQLGAYYTKEDITGYICRNTIVPGLLEKMRARNHAAFDATAWPLLQQEPESYIWPAMRHGVDAPLPKDIAAGLDPDQPDLIEKRKTWNRRATESHALSTEIWREVVARRQRYEEIRTKLAAGEVHEINDLITYNLNSEQFAQDLVARSEDPDIVRALWRALVGVVPDVGSSKRAFEYGFSVLDPTCGSGAFLFAALNILEPLYRACLTRMRAFVLQADLDNDRQKYPDFRKLLADVDSRPNENYFICKSIIVNNLYGVDIVEEAVEIAKLRLFLQLVAQLDDKRHIEPLPDIDFNIRAGNALVGFATYDEVKKAVTQENGGQAKMLFDDAMTLIEQDAHAAERGYLRFRQQQVALGGEVTAEDKQALRDQLTALEDRLNWYLAREYGIDPAKTKEVEKWKASYKPFHWFVDFYGIVTSGGFDSVIGNPPYLPLKDLRGYSLRGFQCIDCGNLYAVMIERFALLVSARTRLGVIVPVSSISTDGYASLQKFLSKYRLYASSYDDRPSRLFDGLEHIRLSILITAGIAQDNVFATKYHKWSAAERATLFQRLQYQHSIFRPFADTILKVSSDAEHSILRKLFSNGRLGTRLRGPTKQKLFYSRKVGYFLQVVTFVPTVRNGSGELRDPSEFKTLYFESKRDRDVAACLLNSTLFFWFLTLASDCRHVNAREVEGMAYPKALTDDVVTKRAAALVSTLMKSLRRNAETKRMKFKHDVLEIECLVPKRSYDEIVQIDDLMSDLFGLTENEKDYVGNYEIKYRLGSDTAND